MTTFIISCSGDPESGIPGKVTVVPTDLGDLGINKGNIRKFKKGLAEVFQEFWNAGPVRIRKVTK